MTQTALAPVSATPTATLLSSNTPTATLSETVFTSTPSATVMAEEDVRVFNTSCGAVPNPVVSCGLASPREAIQAFNGVGSPCAPLARSYMQTMFQNMPIFEEDVFPPSQGITALPEGLSEIQRYGLRGPGGVEGLLIVGSLELDDQIACVNGTLKSDYRVEGSVGVWVFAWSDNYVVIRAACGNFAVHRGKVPYIPPNLPSVTPWSTSPPGETPPPNPTSPPGGPTPSPQPTQKPTDVPQPTQKPTDVPRPTEKPTDVPRPTEKPPDNGGNPQPTSKPADNNNRATPISADGS